MLNGQTSEWAVENIGFFHSSILCTLYFLVHINDLLPGLSSNLNLFTDDTCQLFVVCDRNTSANELNNELFNTFMHYVEKRLNKL